MKTTDDLHTLAWPESRLGEAIEALAIRAGLRPLAEEVPLVPPPTLLDDGTSLGGWIEAAADRLGIEAESVTATYAELDRLVLGAGPALLHLRGEGRQGFLLLLKGGRRTVTLLAPDQAVRRAQPTLVAAALRAPLERARLGDVEAMLDTAGVVGRVRTRAGSALLREWLGPAPIGGCWLLRLPPGADFWRQARHAQVPRHLLGFIGAHSAHYALWIISWWIVGRAALQGRVDSGWLLAWALLLLTLVPLRMYATWAQGMFTTRAGQILKQRLLAGALRLAPEEVRHQGAGQFLGQVVESEALESLALNSGYLSILAAIELAAAALILAAGAGGSLHALLLGGWCAFTLAVVWRFYRQRDRWTTARLGITHDLIERMVGHRTVLAQQAHARQHAGDDQGLDRYLALSAPMDRTTVYLIALISRGWLIVSLLALAPAFTAGSTPAALAIGLGGTLLAFQALYRLAVGVGFSAAAVVAWRQIDHLFRAATRPQVQGAPDLALAAASPAEHARDRQPLIAAHGLAFRYPDRGEPAIQGCNLRIHAGDRLLLEGPSGGGKSTLTALLTGLRQPDAGLLLLGGLDRQTLGDAGWRRRVTAAPQFHENYVFIETFAFNLLMGRRWPPSPDDLAEAEAICRELGLGELLDRMPAGMQQMVGETGWQLSHGERSRLYLARALLQGEELVILDESFAALDPETLARALRCALRRAPTLLVIAHP